MSCTLHAFTSYINLPVYDWSDDTDLVEVKGMELVEPKELVKIYEAVIENIMKLTDTENPLIDKDDWYLYESDREDSFAKQKNILYCAEKLLTWTKQGLYFVEERE